MRMKPRHLPLPFLFVPLFRDQCCSCARAALGECAALIHERPPIQEDLDQGFQDGKLVERPKPLRIALEDLQEELEWVTRAGKVRYIIVASCPARIDENFDVMDQVKEMCAEYDDLVKCTFSYAGNLAADFEAKMKLG